MSTQGAVIACVPFLLLVDPAVMPSRDPPHVVPVSVLVGPGR